MDTAISVSRKKRRVNSKALLLCAGFFLLFLGMIGKGLFENTLLRDPSLGTEREMTIATAAILLRALSTGAVPVFVYFLIGRMEEKGSAVKTAAWLFLLSLACEIPYNLVISCSLWDKSSRNPVFSLFLCATVLAAFKKFGGKRTGLFLKTATVLAALFWAAVLSVKWGVCAVVLCTTLKAFRKKEPLDILFGSAVMSVFVMFSPYYIISPLPLIAISLLRQR